MFHQYLLDSELVSWLLRSLWSKPATAGNVDPGLTAPLVDEQRGVFPAKSDH